MSDPETRKEQEAPDLEKVFTSLADSFKNSNGKPRTSKAMLSIVLFFFSIAVAIFGFINYSKEVDIPKATFTEGEYMAVLYSESGKDSLSNLNHEEVNWTQVRQHLKSEHVANFLITPLPDSGYECQNEQCIEIAFEDLEINNRTRSIDRDFAEFHRKISVWIEGPIPTMLALSALLIGMGIAVTQASLLPALLAISMASFFSFGPHIITSIAVGGLPKQEAVAQVSHVSTTQEKLSSISKSSATLLASQFYAQIKDLDKLERLVDDIDTSKISVSGEDEKRLMQLIYTLDTTANGYSTIQASAEYEQSYVNAIKDAKTKGVFLMGFGGIVFALSLLLRLTQVKTTSIRDLQTQKE